MRKAAAWTTAGLLIHAPILLLFVQSLFPEGRFSPEHYLSLISIRMIRVFLRSAILAAGAALIALVLGVFLAFLLETRRIPFRPVLRLAALAPLLLPPYMQVAAWKPLVGDLIIREEWIRMPLVILILGCSLAPLVFFFASQGIRGISGDLLDAARATPVSEWMVAARIILPLAAPAIAAGTAMVFVLALLDREIPSLLLVRGYSLELYHLVFSGGPGAAFAAAVPGILLSLALVTVSEGWARRRGFSVTGSENPSAPLPLRRIEPPVVLALVVFGGMLVAFPLVRLLWMAGSPRTWGEAFQLNGSSIFQGIPITLGSALLATSLAALILGRNGQPSLPAAILAWVPLAVPGTILGAALVESYNRPVLEVVYGSWGILVISSAARFFPIAFYALAAHLRTVPRDLWDAADLAAAPATVRLSRVYFPLAAPGLALAATSVAIFQAGELEASILVAPPGCEPVSRFIASQLHYNVDLDVPAALCLFQVAAVLIVVALIRFAARFLMRENRSLERETMP